MSDLYNPFEKEMLLTRHALELVEAAHTAGANFIYPAFGITLRENQRIWYFEKLDEIFPGQDFAQRYRKAFGNNYQCTSLNARRLWKVFTERCEEYKILYRMKDIIHAYKGNYGDGQMNFLELLQN